MNAVRQVIHPNMPAEEPRTIHEYSHELRGRNYRLTCRSMWSASHPGQLSVIMIVTDRELVSALHLPCIPSESPPHHQPAGRAANSRLSQIIEHV